MARMSDAVRTIDATLSGAVESGGLAGVVATVGDSNGTIYDAAFGVRDVETQAAMTTDTVMWIASMTKAVTGVAAMQLVEKGELELDGPAGDVLPYLNTVGVLDGFDTDGQPILRPPTTQITLRQLLTHTAGFGYDIWSPELGRYQEVADIPGVTTCELASLTTPLLFDPGTAWQYGINIDWVGRLVEEVSGMTLGAFFRANILEPLAMTSTDFTLNDDMRGRVSSVHARADDGQLGVFPFAMPEEPEFEMGGGGLYSTAADYLRFSRAILNRGSLDGEQILSPDTVAEMSRNNMGAVDVVTLTTAIPAFSNDANLFPDMVQKWGLSFLINTEESKEGRSAGSLAWAGLANSYYWIDPAKDVCGVWGTQLVPFADEVSLQNFRDFERAVYAGLAR